MARELVVVSCPRAAGVEMPLDPGVKSPPDWPSGTTREPSIRADRGVMDDVPACEHRYE
jgi:hypothetical protein